MSRSRRSNATHCNSQHDESRDTDDEQGAPFDVGERGDSEPRGAMTGQSPGRAPNTPPSRGRDRIEASRSVLRFSDLAEGDRLEMRISPGNPGDPFTGRDPRQVAPDADLYVAYAGAAMNWLTPDVPKSDRADEFDRAAEALLAKRHASTQECPGRWRGADSAELGRPATSPRCASPTCPCSPPRSQRLPLLQACSIPHGPCARRVVERRRSTRSAGARGREAVVAPIRYSTAPRSASRCGR